MLRKLINLIALIAMLVNGVLLLYSGIVEITPVPALRYGGWLSVFGLIYLATEKKEKKGLA